MNKKNKILLIGWNGPGGADVVVENLRSEYERKGIETHVVKHNFGNPKPVLSTSKGTKEFGSFGEFIRNYDASQYFAVHNHSCTIEESEVRALKGDRLGNPPYPLLSTAPYIYTIHSLGIHDALRAPVNAVIKKRLDSMPESQRRHAIRKEMEGIESEARANKGKIGNEKIILNQHYQLEGADRLVSMTSFGHNVLGYYYPEYEQKGVVIPNGSDFYRFYNDREVEETAGRLRQEVGNNKVITFVGRVTADKGAKVLAEAFNRVKKTRKDVKLVYVGGNWGDRELINSTIEPQNLGDVFLTGWKDPMKDRKFVAAEYKISDVVVVPSYFESFGLAALEAAMMGTPVVASAVDGLGTEFVNNQLAYGAMPGNPDNVADMILYVLSNPERSKRNAEVVRKAVTERYSLDVISDSNIALYLFTAVELATTIPPKRNAGFYQKMARPTTPSETELRGCVERYARALGVPYARPVDMRQFR